MASERVGNGNTSIIDLTREPAVSSDATEGTVEDAHGGNENTGGVTAAVASTSASSTAAAEPSANDSVNEFLSPKKYKPKPSIVDSLSESVNEEAEVRHHIFAVL